MKVQNVITGFVKTLPEVKVYGEKTKATFTMTISGQKFFIQAWNELATQLQEDAQLNRVVKVEGLWKTNSYTPEGADKPKYYNFFSAQSLEFGELQEEVAA